MFHSEKNKETRKGRKKEMLYVLIFFAVQIFLIFKITMHFVNDPARKKRDCIFTLFAPPGCGKTTTLALLVAHYTKKK